MKSHSKQSSLYSFGIFYLTLLIMGILFVTRGYAFIDFDTGEIKTLDRIARSISIIQKNYYDPSRINPSKMLKEGLYALSNKVPEVLVIFPEDDNDMEFTIRVYDQSKKISFKKPNTLADIMTPVKQSFQFLGETYKGDIEEKEQEYSFIAGMLKTLDPHSNILTPKVFEEFKTQTSGEYGGIGIVVGLKEEDLTVIAPLEGTPAAKLGVQTDDKIMEIDQLPTVNMPLSEAVERLRGKVGSKVTLLLQRKNREPFEVTITRQIISIESVRSKLIVDNGKKIGVLSIRSFQEETFLEMQKALKSMMAEGHLDGLILDLRNNPGGLLDQSLEIADRFLSEGNILYTVGAGNLEEEVARAHLDPSDLTDIPLITLVDQGSASASEIVSGALKNNQRSLIMGTQTFGKGSVQSLFNLRDGSSIKLTIAQYLTPGRVSIQAIGITPDIEITPALVSDEDMDLLNDNGEMGEKNLDEHLENQELIKKSKPVFSLRYLQELKKDPTKESEYTVKIDEKNDYPLSLALKILKQTKGYQKLDLVTQALPLLAIEAVNQDNILTQALSKRKIDWSRNQSKIDTPITLNIESSFIDKKTGVPTRELKAGDEIEWVLKIQNPLGINISRLIGIVLAENPFLNSREFIFGKIDSMGFASAKIDLKIPEETIDISENITLRFLCEQSARINSAKIPVAFVGKTRPVVAYQLNLKDDGTQGSHGNGNLKVEKGEKIALIPTFINRGNDNIANAMVNLKNLEGGGLFLREGRATIKDLKPQGEATPHLLFEVGNDYEKNDAKIEMTFIDKSTRSGFTDTLLFPLNSDKKQEPSINDLQILPTISVKINHQENSSAATLEGEIKDDHEVVDVLIYVNGRKVFYQAQQSAAPSMRFNAPITLEGGLNVVTIEARDNRKLTARKTLSLMGPAKPIEPLKTGLLW